MCPHNPKVHDLSLELVIFKFHYYDIISFLVDTVFKESNDDSCLSSRFGERKLGRESVLDWERQ